MTPEDKGEAVCFTAGPQGAPFGAGVIHAWLVADRPAPKVVAGISTGSITAAAMQRAMIERGRAEEPTDASRWGWFQGYLTDVLDRPLDVIWKAFPDPVDYFSATMPVRDLSCPDELKPDERNFRYHFWQLTKIGKWMSCVAVSIGQIGKALILKVRLDEAIPVPVLGTSFAARMWRWITFLIQASTILIRIMHAVVWHPGFTRTLEQFVRDEFRQASGRNGKLTDEEKTQLKDELDASGRGSKGFPFRPLFGWKVWLFAAVFEVIALVTVGIALPVAVALGVKRKRLTDRLKEAAARIEADGLLTPDETGSLTSVALSAALRPAGLDLSLLSNYQLKRRIWNRFEDPQHRDRMRVNGSKEWPTQLVVVAAVLQKLNGVNQQAWAADDTRLVEALTTACAVPRLFPPTHISACEAHQWIRKKDLKKFKNRNDKVTQDFDLIDGSVIRKNPLPALFNWLQEHEAVATSLVTASKTDARIHVIYGVPIEPFDANNGKPSPDRIDLVESAQVGILMRARRDTSIEVRQTNFLSEVVHAETEVAPHSAAGRLAIFADEIAPERELKFENLLSPTRAEGLEAVAEGCRRTLGRLYENKLKEYGLPSVPCREFIRDIRHLPASSASICGLPEVCAKCSGQLVPYPVPKRVPDIVKPDPDLNKQLPNLCHGDKPKITFVASGGVFAGSFHIGLIGALQALDKTPDLIVGASVGTLMGGALAAIRNSPDKGRQLRLLACLTDTFLRVDQTVALTVPLKTAVKQLGLRSMRLRWSPARLRDAVRAGTANDAGYAATGVPPVVTDTLSQLFIIPPTETFRAGSAFLAGRFASAAGKLISLIRKNTLDSLGVRYAVIGTSLLERVARTLLEGEASQFDLQDRQPYLKDGKGTAIFCTTAYVNRRWLLVLGRDALFSPSKDFSFLHAALSSSAFPAAFPARQEREVFPGTGKITNLFCDGGTFDNLPFMPAIELLSQAQKQRFENKRIANSTFTEKQFLDHRLREPDLILSGGFDPAPANDRRQRFTSQWQVAVRAKELGSSVKTESFIAMSKRVAKELGRLSSLATGRSLPENVKDVMIRSVVAGVVSLAPSTQFHVNPAFGFSRTLGFEPERVGASVANGCFQTLRALRLGREEPDSEVRRSLTALKIEVEFRQTEPVRDGDCPYFVVVCPFFQAAEEIARRKEADMEKKEKGSRAIYRACVRDPVHRKLISISKPAGSVSPVQPGLAAARDRTIKFLRRFTKKSGGDKTVDAAAVIPGPNAGSGQL